MREFPFFSIVVPTFNRAALIGKTLESIWQQIYTNYEVIVVDNCSTDNTEEVLGHYIREKQLIFIRHDRNYERACSRNTGMNRAKGDFVTFLDSDDLMYPANLQDAADYVLAHPNAKCFHNLYEFVDMNGEVVYRPKFPSLDDQIRAISQGNFMSCIGDFIHRDIYSQIRFDTDPSMIGGEDWDFWLRVLSKYPVGRIGKVNSAVVQHEDRSVNKQNITTLERGLNRIVQKMLGDPNLASVYKPYVKNIESSSMMYLAGLANVGKMYQTALSFLYAAVNKNWGVLGTLRFYRILQITLSGCFRAPFRRRTASAMSNQIE